MGVAARYAKTGDVHIAYVVEGEADMDLIWVPTWISQCEHLFSEPSLAAVGERVGHFARMITFDRRGSGMSDPMIGAPTLEEQMDDILAVMEAVGSERVAIFGTLEGGPLAMLFAATYPEKVRGLVLYSTFARATWAPDYDWTWTKEERDASQEQLIERWGEGWIVRGLAPNRAEDPAFVEWGGRMERLAASPGTIRKIFELIGEFDVRHVLPSIRVPTLVMHRPGDEFIDFKHAQYIADRIPDARLVELEGKDNLFSMGDVEGFVGEIEEFLTGARHEREPDRMLATVLFTDIVDSTRRAAELGDSGWRQLLQQHDSLVRRALERHRGREIKSTGDGFLATFDGPARGLRCAASIAEGVRSLGIEVRAGLHTGEIELMNSDVGGLAVHIGARVMGAAANSEVLVSSTVKDLVVGSGIEFEDRGTTELKGVPGEWRLFAVA